MDVQTTPRPVLETRGGRFIVLGVDPGCERSAWFAWDGFHGVTGPCILRGAARNQLGLFSTILADILPDLVAIEDQWLGPNFQGVKALIAHRGALAGVAALFGYQVEVVNTGSWQSRIGARRGTRRDAIKRLSLAFARRVTGLEFDTQDEADAACIAITTWDTARRGRMAGAGRK